MILFSESILYVESTIFDPHPPTDDGLGNVDKERNLQLILNHYRTCGSCGGNATHEYLPFPYLICSQIANDLTF